MKQTNPKSRYFLPILAGLLAGTSYIPFPPWALFFCLVPLFLHWHSHTGSPLSYFVSGWLTQFVFTLIGFHWVAHTAHEFGQFSWWLSFLFLVAFAAVAHWHYALAGVAYAYSQKYRPLRNPAAQFALMALLLALLGELWPMAAPWNLGYPWLWAGLPGAQLADIVGFAGLGHITIGLNAAFAYCYTEWRTTARTRMWWRPLAICVAVFLAMNFWGWSRAAAWKNTDATIKVLAVQGNIGSQQKQYAEFHENYRTHIIEQYSRLTETGLQKNPDVDLVIWPETAYPSTLDPHFSHLAEVELLRDHIKQFNKPLITGAFSRDAGPGTPTHNGLFIVNSSGTPTAPPYRKTILVLFGERFPLADWIPYMPWLFPGTTAQMPGPGPHLIQFNDWRIAPQICYESLDPRLSAEMTKLGAQFFINVTNDSWFDTRFEPQQHLFMTLGRAIETRRPLIRVTNTGITTAILASGKILPMTQVGEESSAFFKIDYLREPPRTIYSHAAGFAPLYLLAALSLLFLFDVYGELKNSKT